MTVCVFSFHPLVFPAFQSLLAGRDIDLRDCRLPPEWLSDWSEVSAPAASIYIVELSADPAPTEALIAKVLDRYPSSRVLAVAEKFEEAIAFPLLRLGIKGLVTYQDASKQLARALEAIAGGGFWVPRSLLSRFVESTVAHAPPPRSVRAHVNLTRREREVLEALLEHLSNKEIAKKLHVTERTAKFHVSNLLAKHHVRRRNDLILLFLSHTNRPVSQ